MKNIKILFSSVKMSGNFGFPCIVMAMEHLLNQKDHETSFFYDGNEKDAYEMETRKRYGMKTHSFGELTLKTKIFRSFFTALLFRMTGKMIGSEKTISGLKDLSDYSAVIDLYGIVYTDSLPRKKYKKILNAVLPFLFINRLWLLSKMMGVPVIKNTAAIGPCKTLGNRFNVKINLGFLSDMVIARDEISYKVCKDLSPGSNCLISPDTAFCTPVAKEKQIVFDDGAVKDKYLSIGISHQIAWRFDGDEYCQNLSELIDFIMEKYDVDVVLVPNEYDKKLKKNDFFFSEHLKKIMMERFQKKVYILNPEKLKADEIKMFISSCSAVITARYHTMIAALSTGTPVFVISWHHKYITAMKMFNCEKYVVETDNFLIQDVKDRFCEFYENRFMIKENINENLLEVKKKVESAVDEVFRFIVKIER
ncbi:MAG TPA: polysaccharide pyruvyl transferase family protein [bacterium]|nr:polysaccharide pyruvyl transferase family protein [bacterium]HQN71865.1 polysaccharide pyruvyl transferase family protein [bacterium]